MSKLNRDVLYLIFQELQHDKKSLCLCLLVNKAWCEIIIPILWKDPWKHLSKINWKQRSEEEVLLLKVIISHLSDESKNNLKDQGINFLTNSYKRPLFDYVSFCKNLNLNEIQRMVNNIYCKKPDTKIIKNEIINLFINENMKFTHFYIPQRFDYQTHFISGAERCFSEIKFLSCNTSINDNILGGLIRICKSINELELFIEVNNSNDGIVKLIEAPKKLFNIRFLINYSNRLKHDESFCKILENSLIKHANTIQYFKITKQPTTKILSSLVNLKILELCGNSINKWDCLEKLSLPFLQILRAIQIPVNVLTSLIENTSGHLIEVSIVCMRYNNSIEDKRIIQVIYQNCPDLKYLKLEINNNNILELEKLLIGCQYLNGLFLICDIDCDNLFEILAKSSPTGLFKFKFNLYFNKSIKLESLKLFFDNWKGRHPMLLHFCSTEDLEDLMEKYKEEGIIKKFSKHLYGDDFVWI